MMVCNITDKSFYSNQCNEMLRFCHILSPGLLTLHNELWPGLFKRQLRKFTHALLFFRLANNLLPAYVVQCVQDWICI